MSTAQLIIQFKIYDKYRHKPTEIYKVFSNI